MEKKMPSAVENQEIVDERCGGEYENQVLGGPGNRRTSRAAVAPFPFFN
jgi:hypothetical protein